MDQPFHSPTQQQPLSAIFTDTPLPEYRPNTCRACKNPFDLEKATKRTPEELVNFRAWLNMPPGTEIIICDTCWPQLFADHRTGLDRAAQMDLFEVPLLTLR